MAFARGLEREEREEREKDIRLVIVCERAKCTLESASWRKHQRKVHTKQKKEKQCGVVPENARTRVQNVIRDSGMIWRETDSAGDGSSRVAVVVVEMRSRDEVGMH